MGTPTLSTLRRTHPFAFSDLARAAGVRAEVVYRMLLDAPVRREDATRVLAAFSQQVGRGWTLETVQVVLTEGNEPENRLDGGERPPGAPSSWREEASFPPDRRVSRVQAILGGPVLAVTEIISPPFLPQVCEAIIVLLKSHGCAITVHEPGWRIAFPGGTTKQEVYPRCLSVRYLITFPDGFTLSETISCISGASCLSFDADDLQHAAR